MKGASNVAVNEYNVRESMANRPSSARKSKTSKPSSSSSKPSASAPAERTKEVKGKSFYLISYLFNSAVLIILCCLLSGNCG